MGASPLFLTSVKAAAHLARALAACPALEQLHLGSPFPARGVFGTRAPLREVLRKRTLRDFLCGGMRDDEGLWTGVMADLARLTHLQALEEVPLRSRADCEALAAHTQLTRLAVSAPDHDSVPLALLSRLSALQVLRLQVGNLSPCKLVELVAPMASLRSLWVACEIYDPDLSQMDGLLASLPVLTELMGVSICAPASTILPDGTRPNGFAGLRRLSLHLDLDGARECGNFAAALEGLESLDLTCNSITWHNVARQLPPMPHLTELKICALPPEPLGNPSARFLAGLPRLRRLDLQNVLDASRWDEEVLYIAALTELRELGISFIRWWEHGNPLMWTQVQPLTALRQLDVIKVPDLWYAGLYDIAFCNVMKQVRQEMGYPSARILQYPCCIRWSG
eukprot:jgi/Botrbrau1/16586/Bobra.0068s0017.1